MRSRWLGCSYLRPSCRRLRTRFPVVVVGLVGLGRRSRGFCRLRWGFRLLREEVVAGAELERWGVVLDSVL